MNWLFVLVSRFQATLIKKALRIQNRWATEENNVFPTCWTNPLKALLAFLSGYKWRYAESASQESAYTLRNGRKHSRGCRKLIGEYREAESAYTHTVLNENERTHLRVMMDLKSFYCKTIRYTFFCAPRINPVHN